MVWLRTHDEKLTFQDYYAQLVIHNESFDLQSHSTARSHARLYKLLAEFPALLNSKDITFAEFRDNLPTIYNIAKDLKLADSPRTTLSFDNMSRDIPVDRFAIDDKELEENKKDNEAIIRAFEDKELDEDLSEGKLSTCFFTDVCCRSSESRCQ
jgi:hypothetical protein